MTLQQAAFDRYAPHDRRKPSEWGPDYVVLLPPISRTGPLDLSLSRHFVEPLDAMWDFNVRQVNVAAPTRSGKTLIVETFAASVAARRPASFLWSFQDEEAAADEANLRLWPQFLNNRLIVPLMPRGMDAKAKQIIMPRMVLQIVGPADSNFQSRGYQIVVLDEVWLYKRGKVEEARARLGDFEKLGTDKFILLSQGGETGSDWDTEFQRGLLYDWHVACEKCGHYMPTKVRAFRQDGSRWGLMFDNHKDERGLLIESRVVPTVRFECEKCAHPHIWSNNTRSEWNRTGKYIEEPNSEKRPIRKSFHWNSLIDTPWDSICSTYVFALNSLKSGNPIPLIKFLQKTGAEMSSESTILEGGQVFSRVDVKSEEWEFEDLRVMAVDKQEDHYWAEVRAFSKRLNGESRRYWFGKLYSYAEIAKKQEEYKIEPSHVLIDSGYEAKGERGVYLACVQYGWIAVKGVGTITGNRPTSFRHRVQLPGGGSMAVEKSYSEAKPGDPEVGKSGQGRSFCPVIMFSSDALADRLDSLIENDLYKEPIVDESDPLEIERRRHFQAEFKKPKVDKFSGRTVFVRVCPSKQNHSYDLGKILTLGAILGEAIPDPYDEKRAAA